MNTLFTCQLHREQHGSYRQFVLMSFDWYNWCRSLMVWFFCLYHYNLHLGLCIVHTDTSTQTKYWGRSKPQAECSPSLERQSVISKSCQMRELIWMMVLRVLTLKSCYGHVCEFAYLCMCVSYNSLFYVFLLLLLSPFAYHYYHDFSWRRLPVSLQMAILFQFYMVFIQTFTYSGNGIYAFGSNSNQK
jgi:ABC-type xylose transport system permease subunit